MLIQFEFKNYLSFRDVVTLDLSATKMTEFNERVVDIGGEKILPVAAIYGANASGKSNIYNAFGYMTNYVIMSLHYGDEPDEFEEHRPTPFLFDDDSSSDESSFEVYFTMPGDPKEKIYNYGFCIGKEGVAEEWLNTKARTAREYKSVFYRSEEQNELDLEGIPKNQRSNIEIALDKQVLIVSLGAKLKIDILKKIRDWFMNNEFADFGDTITSLRMSRTMPQDFDKSSDVQDKVLKYFASFDDSIKGFNIEEVPDEEDERKIRYRINTKHKKIGTDEMVEIPMYMESAGTLKMFALYPELKIVLERGGVYFVDELNARLHPLLVRNIILIFLNPKLNVNHAQLIFTTHDTWHLANNLLRRDEIWFVEKDSDGVSSLFSLADYIDEEGSKIRKDENYEKNYLLGKYGAIPELKNIDFLIGE